MPIIEEERWKTCQENNTDPYGKCCVDIAREVMRLLDTEDYKKFDANDLISIAEKNIDEEGITGYMAGAIASIVAGAHSRGKEFQRSWNEYFGVPEEKLEEGIVNPAIVTAAS